METRKMIWLQLTKILTISSVLTMMWSNVDSLIYRDSMLPLYAEEGGTTMLKCSFSQTPKTILSWWKDNHNFYTHENGTPATTTGAGISWDNLQVKNNGQLIIISNITKATAGWYKSVVTFTDYTAAREDPSRSPIIVDIRAKRLVVVKLPRHPPVIRGSVTNGVLTAMCQAPSSWPPVTLRWYKNNESVPKYKVSQDSGIISRMTLPLDDEDVINLICTATVEVKCEEKIGTELQTHSEVIYWEKASVAVNKYELGEISNSSVYSGIFYASFGNITDYCAMSLEDEKIKCIESNNVSDKRELNEDDILKLNIQNEIDLKSLESVQDMEISNDMTDACKTVCEICHKVITLSSMRFHTLKVHEVQITKYKHLYGNLNIIKKVYHKCHICGKTVLLDNDYLGGHIKGTHKMKEKEYKDKYMALASPKSQLSINKKVMEDDTEGNANNEVVKSGVKRKLGKIDCNSSKTFQMSKEKNPSLVRKQKQRSDISIESSSNPYSVPQKKIKLLSKKINLEANIIKGEIIEVQKAQPIESPYIIKDVHDYNKLTEDIYNADFIIDNSQDIESYGDIGDAITNKVNIEDIASESTDESKDVSKDNNSEWISDCENNGLYCYGGPTVKKGWKICFEESEIGGRKVMCAKYMSPGGSIYTRGENGYQIAELL